MKKERVALMWKRWMPYTAAKQVVQSANIKSRTQFWEWWNKYTPISIPKMPHRVYPEWAGWNDFLGIDNTFQKNEKRKYRPFWEAIRVVHSFGFKTKPEYLRAHEQGKIPKDIPKAPSFQYDEWVDWPHWLGVKANAKVSVAKVNVAVLAICARTDMPAGYFECIIDKNGLVALKDGLTKRANARLIKAYKWDPSKTDLTLRVLSAHGTKYDDVWLIRNVNGLLFDLDGEFDWAS